MDEMGKRDALMNQLAEIEEYFAGCAENAAKGSKDEVHFMVLKNAAKIAREKLKAQEPLKPVLKKIRIGFHTDAVHIEPCCGGCGHKLEAWYKYCPVCGRAVKLDG